MTKEYILAKALKKMMAFQTLETINVKTLTQACGVTRQTFYYHFHDIYDLLTWIYLHEDIDGLEKVKAWPEALMKIGRYCLNNKTFVKQTYLSAGRDLLIEFLSNRLYGFHLKEIENRDVSDKIDADTRKRLAQFYSAALNAVLLNWISEGMNEPLADIVDKLSLHLGDYLNFIDKGVHHDTI
ncbi:MAG TPA: TetR/AcrR family transcriptional regulator C-terminal domain-containing protein [Bacilli bacterium]|jgi:AcrR family transcriptional regulator|nr:TetR/AcrR family transcriptional regulator C-terminal domain-containing protein [Bacilli bacterium]